MQRGSSRVLNGFTELSEGYRDAVNAMRYASRSKTGGVRYITDEEPFSGVDMDYVMKVVASIEEKIRGGSREELEEYLWEVFGHLRDENNSREKVNFMLVEILSSRLPDYVFRICRVRRGGFKVGSVHAADGIFGQLLKGRGGSFRQLLHDGQGSDFRAEDKEQHGYLRQGDQAY